MRERHAVHLERVATNGGDEALLVIGPGLEAAVAANDFSHR